MKAILIFFVKFEVCNITFPHFLDFVMQSFSTMMDGPIFNGLVKMEVLIALEGPEVKLSP